MKKKPVDTKEFFSAIQSNSNVRGYTHDFYNYPARFSPQFAREAIKTFTKPEDFILDPFVGGGTTMVEAKLLDRHCIGLDISSLATFIAKIKTTPISPKDIEIIKDWSFEIFSELNCRTTVNKSAAWVDNDYLRNVSHKSIWPIRRLIEHFINFLDKSSLSKKQTDFLRCCVLKTGQWALDNKKIIPTADEFRDKLYENIEQMCEGASDFYQGLKGTNKEIKSLCFNQSSSDLLKVKAIQKMKAPKLILTSPPYPGVHVVYHRWQIQGRKETPVPFWIANSLDGHGLTHYAMGGRTQKGLDDYFTNILKTFSAIKNVCSKETLVVQLLAFSEMEWQLPKYLDVMSKAGFKEVNFSADRIWRNVPNRKWYANQKGKTESSNEVVLFHKLSS